MIRLLLLVMAAALACWAPVASASPDRPNHLKARIVAQSEVPPAGGVATLAVVFTPDPGWHGYWINPGDAGLGTRFAWQVPDGTAVGRPLYPVPERLIISGLMNHVYEREHALIVQMKLPRGLAAGTALPIRAQAEWLACTKEICVPEQGELAIDLRVGDGSVKPEVQQQFNRWWALLPRPLGSEARFAREGKLIRLGIPYPRDAAIEDPWFFAETENSIDYAAPQQVRRQGDLLIVETRATGEAALIKGVLSTGNGIGLSIEARPGPVTGGGSAIGEPRPAMTPWMMVLALGGAILGGLILNVMPCVFPVISLKAIGLARAGGSEGEVRGEVLAYSAGVILTCLALGSLLLGLRAAGQTVGWAFQLQNPVILLLLLLLAIAITLNLLGLFELPGFGGGERLAGKGGAQGAFWTGALAAFVATPCTGPFMAAALGAALVLPVPAGMAIFAGLGLGLALPFLAIGFVPSLRTRLPRPGAWMSRFRKIMAIPMALTACALFWLLWRTTGATGLGIGGAASLAVAGLLILLGRGHNRHNVVLAGAIAVVATAAAVFLPGPVERAVAKGLHDSQPFRETDLAALRSARRPVFVYFTADWCLTCKVNERAAIEREDVARAFRKAGIAVLVGDWTRGDPAITRFLEAKGRSGVPLYLWYPATGEPRELPQVLTPSMLIELTR